MQNIQNGSEKVSEALTLRDYMAAQALAGLMSKPLFSKEDIAATPKLCYAMADLMLKERTRP